MGEARDTSGGQKRVPESLPEQVHPVKPQREERTGRDGTKFVQRYEMATATYNFVPLPNPAIVVKATPDPSAMHDRYAAGRKTGRLYITVEALTPLFIRGTIPPEELSDSRDAMRLRSGFFAPSAERQIPGSSLRGLSRTLVEILSWCRVGGVADHALFYRDFQAARTDYLRTMATGIKAPVLRNPNRWVSKPQATPGYLARTGAGLEFRPAQQVNGHAYVRVQEDVAISTFPADLVEMQVEEADPNNPGRKRRVPNDAYHWLQREVWFDASSATPEPAAASDVAYLVVSKISSTKPSGSTWQHGWIVASGGAGWKSQHWIIPDEDGSANRTAISYEDEKIYVDEGAISPTIAEQADQTRFRILTHELKQGDPPIPCFLIKHDGHQYFGHTPLFRLPYKRRVRDAFPQVFLDECTVDMADAIFGRVAEPQGFAGRVQFEDAHLRGGGLGKTSPEAWAQILSAPKPTAYQHYLVQTSDRFNQRTDWNASRVIARGHKIHWHRLNADGSPLDWRESAMGEESKDTQHTKIAPLERQQTFEAVVHFQNLSEEELGALLTAICLPEACAHRLGMGKSLGLGSVRLEVTAIEADRRAERYQSLLDTPSQRFVGPDLSGEIDRLRDRFAAWLLNDLRREGDAQAQGKTWAEVWMHPRLRELRALLTYRGAPAAGLTRSMDMEEFRARRRAVLPRASQVAGIEPDNPPANTAAPQRAPTGLSRAQPSESGIPVKSLPEVTRNEPNRPPASSGLRPGKTVEGEVTALLGRRLLEVRVGTPSGEETVHAVIPQPTPFPYNLGQPPNVGDTVLVMIERSDKDTATGKLMPRPRR